MSTIELKSVELKDKAIFDHFFSECLYYNSECNFTYFYMWRNEENFKWDVIDNCLCLIADKTVQPYCLAPYGVKADNVCTVLDQIEKRFAKVGKPFMIRAITSQFLELFEQALTGRYSLQPNRDAFDYVYSGNDLRELSGRKYSGKRNHINAFLSQHPDFRYAPITDDNVKECLSFIDSWFANHPKNYALIKEKEAIVDILQSIDDLALTGAIIELGGKIEALTLGEALNAQTALIHVEKANNQIRGLYQIINREFCRRAWPDKLYINREEDMGLPGLRKAKQSYFPLYLLEKHEALPQEAGAVRGGRCSLRRCGSIIR